MTATDVLLSEAPRGSIAFPRILTLALREARTGLKGFYVFIACVALGVAAITAIGALTDALRAGLESQGQTLLGGDVTLARVHARATPAERNWLQAQGRLSETATMRTMARRPDGSDQALAELKAVDGNYPLVGTVKLKGGATLAEALGQDLSAAVDPILLERLGFKVGDAMSVGQADVRIAAAIESEPDGISDRLTYGPRVLLTLKTLEATGMVHPGTLIRWRYALKLPEGADAAVIPSLREAVKQQLPESGFTVVDRRDPSPRATRTLERMRQFLTLVGLTALLVGGVGIANAVSTFIDKRRKVIATYKSLGATGRLVFSILLVQVMLMAGVGVAIGLALGYMVPIVLNVLYGGALPIQAEISISASSVITSVVYGFLVALIFALWPLGRADRISAAALFRDDVDPQSVWPRPAILALTAAALAVLIAFALVTSEAMRITLYFCLGLLVMFAVFIGLGLGVTAVARRLRRPRRPELALAVGHIAAPGGLTRDVVLSLGAGLSLLVAVALTDASIVNQLAERLPDKSPDYFVLDIPKGDYDALADLVRREAPGSDLNAAPMLRGRLVRLKDTPVEQIKAPPEAEWVLSGDRGLTYAKTVPQGSRLVDGTWWDKDYAGEPLVSFEVDLAHRLGLAIGDKITVNVLGRNVTARIANLREVDWESLAINFVMVFSPNTLQGAPNNLLATITLPKGTTLQTEAGVARSLSKAYPAVTTVRVRDAIAAFNAIFGKVMVAVRSAGSVTLLAGALVLAGALATAQRRRILEAVILKAVGATSRRILAAHFAEYAILATLTALFAVGLGTLGAWIVLTFVMEVPFSFSWGAVALALSVSAGLVALFGGLGTWQILRTRPVPYLRSE